ncbi:hypothetical protein T11_9311 [Trichinella zimbabwensis]|uniref:Uncharacterized protein n=1 Tax=Trichinella zimbabwensis TaxID=268475 RepID=A0A0V1H2P3_9BILA|nr:hypothetical protein T11_9311 [Trichinella zimbabwensis]
MNQQAGRSHLRFYELLLMLIDEQGSVETLNQWVTSLGVTDNHLQIEKDKYEDMQQRIIGFTAEYDCGTRTKEQLSRAVAYGIPEQVNFSLIGSQDRYACDQAGLAVGDTQLHGKDPFNGEMKASEEVSEVHTGGMGCESPL